LPPCNTTEEIKCIGDITLGTRKARYECLGMKKIINIHADEADNRILSQNGTGAVLKAYSKTDTKVIKHEILVVSTEQFIGSIGGSLGLFLGFSFFTFFTDVFDKIIMFIQQSQL